MANGAPNNTARPIKFKRGFKPRKVQIDGLKEEVYEFETARVTRSIERELTEAFADIEEDHAQDDDVVFQVQAALIDKLVVPTGNKKKKASEVLRELWDADEIEFADVTDFLGDVSNQRRPS